MKVNILKPNIPKILSNNNFLSEYSEAKKIESDITDFCFSNEMVKEQSIEYIEFAKSSYQTTNFLSCQFSNAFFTDIIFNNCDFSNSTFHHCNFTRVSFENCKLVGSTFDDCSFFHVTFDSCMARYIGINTSCFKQTAFLATCMSNSSLKEDSFQSVPIIDRCDMTSSLIYHTSLANLDFSNSYIDGLSISIENLKGIVVNPMQAIELSKLFGITVNE